MASNDIALFVCFLKAEKTYKDKTNPRKAFHIYGKIIKIEDTNDPESGEKLKIVSIFLSVYWS